MGIVLGVTSVSKLNKGVMKKTVEPMQSFSEIPEVIVSKTNDLANSGVENTISAEEYVEGETSWSDWDNKRFSDDDMSWDFEEDLADEEYEEPEDSENSFDNFEDDFESEDISETEPKYIDADDLDDEYMDEDEYINEDDYIEEGFSKTPKYIDADDLDDDDDEYIDADDDYIVEQESNTPKYIDADDLEDDDDDYLEDDDDDYIDGDDDDYIDVEDNDYIDADDTTGDKNSWSDSDFLDIEELKSKGLTDSDNTSEKDKKSKDLTPKNLKSKQTQPDKDKDTVKKEEEISTFINKPSTKGGLTPKLEDDLGNIGEYSEGMSLVDYIRANGGKIELVKAQKVFSEEVINKELGKFKVLKKKGCLIV